MTTTVTVAACSWPVEIRHYDLVDGKRSEVYRSEVVEPHTQHIIHIWDTRTIELVELPLPNT